MPLLIGFLTFVTVSLLLYEWLRPKPNRVRDRIVAGGKQPDIREAHLEEPFGRRIMQPIAAKVGRGVARLLPHNFVRRIDRMLVMADEPWSLWGFLSTWLVVAIGAVALWFWIVTSNPDFTPLQIFTLAIALIPFPVMIPYAMLRRRVKNRQRAIMRALPDALDLLTTCVEAGLGVDSAFALVTEQSEGPLSESFALYLKEVGLGRTRKDALANVAERTGVPDLVALSAAINQGEELGTTMGDVLRRQAADLRILRRQRIQEAAQRAPVLMTIPLASCFLPAMIAVVVIPSGLNLVRFFNDF